MNRRTMVAWLTGFILLAPASAGQAEAQLADPKARLAKAEAMFAERCKTAGEFIHRTVEDVEGVFLLKLRPEGINYGDQFRMDDPYGRDLAGVGFIETFIRGQFAATHSGTPKTGLGLPPKAYTYVEAIDPANGQRYRYTGGMKVVGRKDVTATNVKLNLQRDPNYDLNIYAFSLDRVPSRGEPLRYGVTYEDISTREERDYWIAGSSLKVVDLKTQEVMAERIGYMMDPGQGNNSGGRSPWLFAADNACPPFNRRGGSGAQPYQSVVFTEKILKPTGVK